MRILPKPTAFAEAGLESLQHVDAVLCNFGGKFFFGTLLDYRRRGLSVRRRETKSVPSGSILRLRRGFAGGFYTARRL